MTESLKLFDDTCNNKLFVDTPIVLIFNKVDVFKDKLAQNVDLSNFYPDFTGGSNFDAASQYLKSKFLAVVQNPSKFIQVYFTTATDTASTKTMYTSVQDALIQHLQTSKLN